MKDLETKQKVLQEIMDLMEGRESDRLKSHPKFAKPKVEAPVEEEGEEMEMADKEEVPSEMPSEEKEESKSDELSDEDIQLLLEKMKDLE